LLQSWDVLAKRQLVSETNAAVYEAPALAKRMMRDSFNDLLNVHNVDNVDNVDSVDNVDNVASCADSRCYVISLYLHSFPPSFPPSTIPPMSQIAVAPIAVFKNKVL
jgi:hypothetical protein